MLRILVSTQEIDHAKRIGEDYQGCVYAVLDLVEAYHGNHGIRDEGRQVIEILSKHQVLSSEFKDRCKKVLVDS